MNAFPSLLLFSHVSLSSLDYARITACIFYNVHSGSHVIGGRNSGRCSNDGKRTLRSDKVTLPRLDESDLSRSCIRSIHEYATIYLRDLTPDSPELRSYRSTTFWRLDQRHSQDSTILRKIFCFGYMWFAHSFAGHLSNQMAMPPPA